MSSEKTNHLDEKFTFRQILPQEADQAVQIEYICFPPNEACSEKMMRERIEGVPELIFFLIPRCMTRREVR